MPRQAGLSILLSFFVIGLVTMFLPDRPASQARAALRHTDRAEPIVAASPPSDPGASPQPTALVAPRDEPQPELATAQPPSQAQPAGPTTTPPPAPVVASPPAPIVPPARPSPVASPRPAAVASVAATPQPPSDWISHSGPFTFAEAGESVADVARRVYGHVAASHHLLAANRDQDLDERQILPTGLPLRTP